MHSCIQSFFYPIEEVPIPSQVLQQVLPWELRVMPQQFLFPGMPEQLRRQD